MKKDIFLVDADNTVLDFHASSFLAIRSAFETFSVTWEERFAKVFTRVNNSLWESLERKEITREELLKIRFPLYLKEVGISNIDGEEFNRLYLKFLAEKPVYINGAEEFLKKLNENGRVYIVTNGTARIQKSRFDIIGLWQYAKDVFISDTIGADKPDKRYTDYVLSHIEDFNRNRSVWIGDSLSADIKAANDGQIDSVWFNPERKELKNDKIRPTWVASNFAEIFAILGIN